LSNGNAAVELPGPRAVTFSAFAVLFQFSPRFHFRERIEWSIRCTLNDDFQLDCFRPVLRRFRLFLFGFTKSKPVRRASRRVAQTHFQIPSKTIKPVDLIVAALL